jgi:hypothetical protein
LPSSVQLFSGFCCAGCCSNAVFGFASLALLLTVFVCGGLLNEGADELYRSFFYLLMKDGKEFDSRRTEGGFEKVLRLLI